MADGAPEDIAAVQKAKMGILSRQWLASRWNRREYGAETAAPNISIDLRTAHLQALRSRQIRQIAAAESSAINEPAQEPQTSAAEVDR